MTMNVKNIWTITPVLTGRFGMVRDDIKFEGGNPEIQDYVPSVLFLLESEDAQVIVDTGFGDPQKCAESMSLLVEREEDYEEILHRHGICAEKVRHVILTHLHWDHAANAHCFPNAFFYCQRAEWERAMNHPEEYPWEWLAFLRNHPEKVRLTEKESMCEIVPGIEVQYTGGHTYGSQMVWVHTANGKSVVTGDAVMTMRNVEEEIPVGLCVNAMECRNVLEIIKQAGASKIYPSHDFSVFVECDKQQEEE